MNWGLVVLLLTCANLAVSERHADRRRELLQQKKVDNSQALVIAVTDGKLEDVERLLDEKQTNPVADVNTTNSAGSTLLMVAAGSNSVEIVCLLLDSGAGVSAFVPDNGFSALHFAAAAGAKEAAEKLIDAGARVDSKTFHNGTPLYIAAQHGQSEMMELLIKNEADVNAMVVNGAPPLLIAAENGHLEAIRVLIEAGADVEKGTKDEVTALHLVVSNLNVSEPIELLLEAGLDVDVEDRWGDTPLDYAAHFGNEEAVDFLIEQGAQISKPDIRDNLPLRSICRCKGSEDFRGQLNCPEGTCDRDAVERLRAKLDPELQDKSPPSPSPSPSPLPSPLPSPSPSPSQLPVPSPLPSPVPAPLDTERLQEADVDSESQDSSSEPVAKMEKKDGQGQDKAEGGKRKKTQRKQKKRNKRTRKEKEKGETFIPEPEKPPKEPEKLELKKPKNVKKSSKDQTGIKSSGKGETSLMLVCEASCWKSEKDKIEDCLKDGEEVKEMRSCIVKKEYIVPKCWVECDASHKTLFREEKYYDDVCKPFSKEAYVFNTTCVEGDFFEEDCEDENKELCLDNIIRILGTIVGVDQGVF